MTRLIYDPNLDVTYDLETLPSAERDGAVVLLLPELPLDELENRVFGVWERRASELFDRGASVSTSTRRGYSISIAKSWGTSSC
jgi:hypothetical protein